MAKSKKEVAFSVLIDLHYKHSMNRFEEFYGESVSYSEIEQVSYIDLKDMVFEKIGKNVKFRKFGRQGNVLTIKMDVTPSDFESFTSILSEQEIDKEATKKSGNGETKFKKFNFIHDFTVTNIRDLTEEEKIKFKKFLDGEKPVRNKNRDDDDFDVESTEEDIELESLDSLDEEFDDFDEDDY